MQDDNGFLPEEKSRSQKKRESTSLQKQGEALAALSVAEWKKLALSEELFSALGDCRQVKTREAKRRQMQYIGRCMRELEPEEFERISAALEEKNAMSAKSRDAQHRLEKLRDSLLSPSAPERELALEELLAAEPAANASRLEHLIDAAVADREKKRPPRHARELFRYLRELFSA